jgi:hypothetical protein
MNKLVDVLGYAFLVGGILVLTRPGSKGPRLVSSLTSGYSHIVQAATGQRLT